MTNGELFFRTFPCLEQDEKWLNLLWWTNEKGKRQLLGDVYDSYFWDEEYKEPTLKNNLGVDCISREQALEPYKILENTDTLSVYTIRQNLVELPSVTPQEPIHGKCDQCKHYEGVHNVQGHAPCSYHKIGGVMWNWYCSQFEGEDEE